MSRALRLAVFFVLVAAAAASAATTTAFDGLVALVLERRSALDTSVKSERRRFAVLGDVAHALSAPSESLADDLVIASRAAKLIEKKLASDAELVATSSTSVDDLILLAAGERTRLAIWTGRLGDAWREQRLATVLAKVDRAFVAAASKRKGSARARGYAGGCRTMEAVRGELVLLGDPPVMPDFLIPDVNPASERYPDHVSPRDYLGKISAWYFGKAG